MGKPKSPEHKEKIRQALLARGKGVADKTCSGCGECKPRDQFGLRKEEGYSRSKCKACERAAALAWRAANPYRVAENNRRASLRRWYGLDEERYGALLSAQGGVCAICRGTNRAGKRLFVDHCSSSGVIRGLLCNLCNMAIGALRHDADTIKRAALYVTNPPNRIEAAPSMPSGVRRLLKP